MNKMRMTGWVLGGAYAVTLGACHSAATRIYALDPAPPQARIDAYRAPPLRVDTLSVPAGWDRIEILTPAAAGALRISDFDHWSAPLAQIARQALSADLDQRLPPGSVIYPRLPKPAGALGISVDILEFRVAASEAWMRASWLITPTPATQSPKRSIALLHEAMISTAPESVVHAWGELTGQLADRIAADAALFSTP